MGLARECKSKAGQGRRVQQEGNPSAQQSKRGRPCSVPVPNTFGLRLWRNCNTATREWTMPENKGKHIEAPGHRGACRGLSARARNPLHIMRCHPARTAFVRERASRCGPNSKEVPGCLEESQPYCVFPSRRSPSLRTRWRAVQARVPGTARFRRLLKRIVAWVEVIVAESLSIVSVKPARPTFNLCTIKTPDAFFSVAQLEPVFS